MSTIDKRAGMHSHLLSRGKQKLANAPGTAQLTYYIFEGVLVGIIGEDMVHMIAWSGGGGGSLKHRTDGRANNPYFYGQKEVDNRAKHVHVHGGPIPPGQYQIFPPSHHQKLGLSCWLKPAGKLVNHRSGFYIHNQGRHGSDGCIVPSQDEFPELMKKLKASKGGTLHVLQSTDGVFV